MTRDEYQEYIHLLMKSACYDELILELERLRHMYMGAAITWYTGSDEDDFIKWQYLTTARELQSLIKAYEHKKSR